MVLSDVWRAYIRLVGGVAKYAGVRASYAFITGSDIVHDVEKPEGVVLRDPNFYKARGLASDKERPGGMPMPFCEAKRR